MFSKQALLAVAAVIGYASGGPLARRLLMAVPGIPAAALTDQAAGAVGSWLAFMIAKRVV